MANAQGGRNTSDAIKGQTYYYNPGDLNNVRDGIVDYAKQWTQITGITLPELPAASSDRIDYGKLYTTLKNAGNDMSNYVILLNNKHYVKVVGITSSGLIIVKDSNVPHEIRALEINSPTNPVNYDVFNFTPVRR